MKHITLLLALVALAACESTGAYNSLQVAEVRAETQSKDKARNKVESSMELGAFSASLSVKDMAASAKFYKTLGFSEVMGDSAAGWLILRNGTTTIGLFHGMFEGNIMTFNPGWDSEAKPLAKFEDVRQIQARLKEAGLKLTTEADMSTSGPASFTLADPDGNVILVDQHVPSPKK